MDRLTFYDEFNNICYHKKLYVPILEKEIDTVISNSDVARKLAEYEDAEEQGRLVVLPCKVGDTVYFTDVADCKSGECPDADTDICCYSRFKMPDNNVLKCKGNHLVVREESIEQITIYDNNGDKFDINEIWTLTSSEIFDSYEEAFNSLSESDGDGE